MKAYKEVVSPFLDNYDSETWHIRTSEMLHTAETNPLTLKLLERIGKRIEDERLHVLVGGVEFENPLMVGAGWDKAGRSVRAQHALGFATEEVGSVLAYPQEGNERPRQWMIAPGVAINSLGFNSPGMEAVAENLRRYTKDGIPTGISVGKNKLIPNQSAPEMYAAVVDRLYNQASYFAINVSSPNTPGLRSLQDKEMLSEIITTANQTMDLKGERKPIFIKIAPDLENGAVDDVIQVVFDNNLAGIIATNTTNNAEIKSQYGDQWRNTSGGLSGDDAKFRKMATDKIRHIYRQTGGKLDIIGVGGVKDLSSAMEKIQAGAKALQIVTGIRGEGPSVAGKINRGLVTNIEKYGVKNISEFVGTSV